MKKLSIEEKAKLYDEAIERANSLLSSNELGNAWIYKVLPELKEGDDEKTRKEIIYHIQNCDDTIDEVTEKRMIDWLEKQGDINRRIQEEIEKQTKQQWKSKKQGVNVSGECNDTALEEQLKIWFEKGKCSGIDDVIFHPQKYGLEKQGEQKQDPCEKCDHFTLNCHNFPCIKKKEFEQGKSALEAVKEEKVDNANKVEPKFKVGDFIVNDYCMGKVIELTDDAYLLDTEQGIPFSYEHNAHLWTIQDAKDGDVLQLGKVIAIFKEFIGNENCRCYCSVCEGEFEIPSQNGDDNSYGCYNATPATKEQCDTLMKAMDNAGYIFDFNKKELKNVGPKPAI